MASTEWQKMLAGPLYRPDAPEIQAAQVTVEWMARYSADGAMIRDVPASATVVGNPARALP